MNDVKRILVIGDLHGCAPTLKEMLKEEEYDASTDGLVFVGDYIDRGNYSYETVEFVKNLQEKGDNVVALMGNHEDLFLTALATHDYSHWDMNGGRKTRECYAASGVPLTWHQKWIEGLPLWFYSEKYNLVVAHAAYPGEDFSADKKHILWDRDWMDEIRTPFMRAFIFGHTPEESYYRTLNGSLCVDSLCVFTGKLSYAVVTLEDGHTKIIPKTYKKQ